MACESTKIGIGIEDPAAERVLFLSHVPLSIEWDGPRGLSALFSLNIYTQDYHATRRSTPRKVILLLGNELGFLKVWNCELSYDELQASCAFLAAMSVFCQYWWDSSLLQHFYTEVDWNVLFGGSIPHADMYLKSLLNLLKCTYFTTILSFPRLEMYKVRFCFWWYRFQSCPI